LPDCNITIAISATHMSRSRTVMIVSIGFTPNRPSAAGFQPDAGAPAQAARGEKRRDYRQTDFDIPWLYYHRRASVSIAGGGETGK
jgi:hypothetical protein